jgi:hypothetical protein
VRGVRAHFTFQRVKMRTAAVGASRLQSKARASLVAMADIFVRPVAEIHHHRKFPE